MNRPFRARRAALLSAVLSLYMLSSGLLASTACAAETLRPEVGRPLQAAQVLIKQQKYKEALVRITQADAVAAKTPYEDLTVRRMRGAAAFGAGDLDTAAKAFEVVLVSGKLSNEEQLKILQSLASSYYRAKEYAKAQTWALRYQRAGGTDPSLNLLLTQSYYLNGDYASAAKALQAQLSADQKSGQIPSEGQLQLLASCAAKQNDQGVYVSALEQLVRYYPKQAYWADLLARVQRKPGFNDRLDLDIYRLMRATGNLHVVADYLEMAQLALQAGYPREAQKVLEQGYATRVLGSGPQAQREKRLKDLADQQAAEDENNLGVGRQADALKDSNAMVNTGYNLVLNGRYEQGLALIQRGIARGDLKHPDEAKLHLGEAYILTSKTQEAARILKTVQGTDGTQDLARLWMAQKGLSS